MDEPILAIQCDDCGFRGKPVTFPIGSLSPRLSPHVEPESSGVEHRAEVTQHQDTELALASALDTRGLTHEVERNPRSSRSLPEVVTVSPSMAANVRSTSASLTDDEFEDLTDAVVDVTWLDPSNVICSGLD